MVHLVNVFIRAGTSRSAAALTSNVDVSGWPRYQME